MASAMRNVRRLVFLFPGFEQLGAEAHRDRFQRAAQKTGAVWQTSFEVSGLEISTGARPVFHVAAKGEGWQAETEIIVCDWSELMNAYQNRSPVIRFFDGIGAMTGFILNGTLWRYLRTSWRYALFFFYPMVLIGVALLPLALYLALPESLAAMAFSAALALALIWVFSRYFHLMLILDNWSFARAAALERDAGISGEMVRLQTLISDRLNELEGTAPVTEIVFAAHSLGAPFAVMALAKSLPELDKAKMPFGLMMAGSSLLKIALHPAAKKLRSAVQTIVEGRVNWLDFQSLTDLLNFYNANPASVLRIKGGQLPRVLQVRFRHLLAPETYRRIKKDFLRVHRQFVLAVERRARYSFHMIVAGPFTLAEIASHDGLPEAFVSTASLNNADLP